MRIAEVLHVPLPSLFDFNHLGDKEDRMQRVEEMLRELGKKDQQRVFKIVKVFRER